MKNENGTKKISYATLDARLTKALAEKTVLREQLDEAWAEVDSSIRRRVQAELLLESIQKELKNITDGV